MSLEQQHTALLLCDVWDTHWCRGAVERLEALVPRINSTVHALRDRGFLIVHAPSETMDFYRGSKARRRALDIPRTSPPPASEAAAPPLPISIGSTQGCDTGEEPRVGKWSRQHHGVDIDDDRDVISDDGAELYSLYRHRGISTVLVIGVHTNMCVLNRSFAIKAMVGWGLQPLLVRDLTDAMYDPADAPYLSHEAGTGLVIEYIERFWCPSVGSQDLG
jgi:nicotinamidase-related amidase